MRTKRARLIVFGCELTLFLLLAAGLPAQQAPTAGSTQGQAVPQLVKFSGTVKDADGTPRTGIAGLTFALYKDQAGSAALWLETQSVTLDAQGRYTVLLGANSAEGVPLDAFTANEARWLGVQPEGQAEQRVLLVSVPYALKAADAETLGGMPASSFVLAAPVATGGSGNSGSQTAGSGANYVNSGAVPNTISGNTGFFPVFTSNAGDQGNSLLYQQAGTNYLGYATTNPQYNFQLVARGEDWLYGGFSMVPAFSGGPNYNTLYGNGGSGFSLIGTARNKGYPSSRLDMGANATINFQTGDGTAAPTSKMFVTAAGNVGIGTTAPGQRLSVAGYVESLAGGFKFPDGSVQTTASAGGVAGVTSITAGTGLTGGTITSSGTIGINTSVVPLLSAANTFNANQTINGFVTAVGGTFSGSNGGVFGEDTINDSTVRYGVQGLATGFYGVGVRGGGNQGINVSVSSSDAAGGVGVFGAGAIGVYGYAGSGVSNGSTGVIGVAGGGFGVWSLGPFAATGTKSAAVPLPDNRVVLLYSMESPEVWLEDLGSATLKDGAAVVALDPTFAQTVNTTVPYHVYLTPEGDCEGLYVTNKTPGSFEVRELRGGKSNTAFEYRIIAKRSGYEDVRIEQLQADLETVQAMREQSHTRPTRVPSVKIGN